MTDRTDISQSEPPLSDWVAASTEHELRAFAEYMAETTGSSAGQDCTFFLYARDLLPADSSEGAMEGAYRRVADELAKDLLWRAPSTAALVLRATWRDGVSWLALAVLAVLFFLWGVSDGDHLHSVMAGVLLVGAVRAFREVLDAARAQRASFIASWRVCRDVQAWAWAATAPAQLVAERVLMAAAYTAHRPEQAVDIRSARVWARCETARKGQQLVELEIGESHDRN